MRMIMSETRLITFGIDIHEVLFNNLKNRQA